MNREVLEVANFIEQTRTLSSSHLDAGVTCAVVLSPLSAEMVNHFGQERTAVALAAHGFCYATTILMLRQDGLHQVAQLLRSELISFEVGGELSLLIDDDGVKRVGDNALTVPEVHSEHAGCSLNLRQRAG